MLVALPLAATCHPSATTFYMLNIQRIEHYWWQSGSKTGKKLIL